MADDIRKFAATLDRFHAQSVRAVREIQRKLILDATRTILRRTPVGNPDIWQANEGKARGEPGFVGKGYVGGHAKRNWQVTIGAPATSEVEGVDPGGQAVIDQAQSAVEELPDFATVYLSNNVPYIEVLEAGDHSRQAPQGMLGITFADIVRKYSTTAEQTLKELGL